MNDMRIPPGLLNALQGTPRDGQDSRVQGQPDIEAARAFDRLFQHALREPAREPTREPVREPAREAVREQAQAERTPERTPERTQDRTQDRIADRDAAANGPRAERQEQRARDNVSSDGAASENDGSADGAGPSVARGRAPGASEAQATARSDESGHAAQAPFGTQLTLDATLLPAQGGAQAAAAVTADAQAASAALLQMAQAKAVAAGEATTDAPGAAKAGPVAKHIDGVTGALGAGKDSKDAKPGVALEATAITAATGEAQARTGVRDRLLEDFERRFERSLAAAAAGGREGFTPGTPQALAALATAGTPGAANAQPIYSSAHASIATPLTQPGFGDELSNRVLLFAGQRVQNAELAVTPADLGPIKVSIELRGQEATLAFTAQHATTRAAIEDALPRLREMFAGQGLQLAQAHVGDQRRQDSGRYNGQRNDGTRAIDGVGGNNGRPSTIGAGGTGGLPNAYGVRGIGLIDIHV